MKTVRDMPTAAKVAIAAGALAATVAGLARTSAGRKVTRKAKQAISRNATKVKRTIRDMDVRGTMDRAMTWTGSQTGRGGRYDTGMGAGSRTRSRSRSRRGR